MPFYNIINEVDAVVGVLQSAETIDNPLYIEVSDYDHAFIGQLYDRAASTSGIPVFVKPAEVEPPPPARRISVGSFFDRFGAQKWPILADTNPMVQALVKDCSVRKFINLDDPQLAGGLAMLVAVGHAIEPEAILSAPVQQGEGV